MRSKATIAFYTIVMLGPLALGIGYSLLYSFGLLGLMSDGFTLRHWQRLWEGAGAINSLGYTLFLTAASLIFTLLLALVLAWGFLQKRGSALLYRSLFIPLMIAPLIAAFAWYDVLAPSGFISRLLWQLGAISEIDDFPRLVNDAGSAGILVTHVFLVFPIFTLLFIELCRKEQMKDLQLTALNLGGGAWHFFLRIFVPLLLQKSKPVIWLYGVFLMGAYEVPLLLGRSAPQTISVFITEKLTRYNLYDIPVGHAMAVVYTLLVFTFVAIFIRKKTLQLF